MVGGGRLDVKKDEEEEEGEGEEEE